MDFEEFDFTDYREFDFTDYSLMIIHRLIVFFSGVHEIAALSFADFCYNVGKALRLACWDGIKFTKFGNFVNFCGVRLTGRLYKFMNSGNLRIQIK
jgi:hypothetical protein